MSQSVKISIVQQKPAFLNLAASMEIAQDIIKKNSTSDIIVFGETWLTGYPAWIDHCPGIAMWNEPSTKEVFAQIHKNGIEVPGKETQLFAQLAKENNLIICLGINEVVRKGKGSGTIYNSLIIFDEQGNLVNHHRKLMPTFNEKLLYGMGDGEGLKTVETKIGNVGGLICWEHWMPLTRQALHNDAEDIHLALWPAVNDIHQLASRHYAIEGRCFVIAAGQVMQVKDFSPLLEVKAFLKDKPDHYVLNGGSCIIAPDGTFLLEPQLNTNGVINFEIDNVKDRIKECLTLDTSGHYYRDDVFQFDVNRKRTL